jgi:multiple sugar transport system substrate-binding protein
VWRKSAVNAAGYDAPPDDLEKYLDLCRKLNKAGKPPGFALGNAVGDGNGFANWLVWAHGGYLVDEDNKVAINRKETVEALKYLQELYKTFIPGTIAWGDISNNRAYAAQEIWLTANGVSMYFALKRDPKLAEITNDTQHSLLPKGKLDVSPMAGLTLNAMCFKHSKFPNAAKALLQFLLEKEQYDPWLQANLGYWSQPLENYSASKVWESDPKIALFKNVMKSNFWIGYKGPISQGSAAANADYIMVQMCAAVASGQSTPEAAAAEAERRAKRFFR